MFERVYMSHHCEGAFKKVNSLTNLSPEELDELCLKDGVVWEELHGGKEAHVHGCGKNCNCHGGAKNPRLRPRSLFEPA